MSKPIIVTGAAGFIGRNLVATLNSRGQQELILTDSLGKEEKWRNLRGLRYEDILSPAALMERIERGHFTDARAILHMGACSSTTEGDADYLLENNYRYTRRLCEFCLKHNIRFVYASSAATYGDGSQGYCDDDSVTPQLHPLNMYGYSKHMFDLWALKAGILNRIAGLKYFNVFGPYEDHKGDMKSVVAKSYHLIREQGKVRLFKSYNAHYADGEQMRDFVYVRDAVDVTLWFLEKESGSGLFNCGAGKARTWKDLATAVFRAMNRPVEIEFIEMPEGLRAKYQYFTEANMQKLRAAGYTRSFTSLEDAVQDYVSTYLATQEEE
jgi:ADP-L-glycero-D-manno-heptose 6-epimerase